MTWIGLWLTAAGLVFSQEAGPRELTTLRDLKNLTPAQAQAGLPVRVKGTVVCYDAGWHQLYLHDGRETLYFNADDFSTQPHKGDAVEITGRARGTNLLENPKLTILGAVTLPPAKRLELADLGREHGEWVQITGRVLSAENSRGRLALLLHDKGENCLVYLLGAPATNDVRSWLGCEATVRGINASRMANEHLESALVFAPGADEIKTTGPADGSPAATPVTSIGGLLNRELGSWTNQWVHVNGLAVSYQPGELIVVKDPTGVIRARVIQLTEIRGDERVDVWGFLEAGRDETYLKTAYFEVTHPPPVDAAAATPAAPLSKVARLPAVLTRVSDILKLRPEEAAQRLTARLRGVITFADSDWRNCFLQEGGDAIYVDLDPIQKHVQPGQWVELEGQTSPGGFAPEVLCSSMEVLGTTNLPAPARVDLEDLANGHFDSHWVEMEGVVRRVDELSGHASLSLMTPKGRFRAIVPGFEGKPLPIHLLDCLVSVQGACTSELNVRRQLSGITLHVPGLEQIRVLEPAPTDPFSIATTRIDAVATFDPDRFAGRRVKIQGVVTLRMTGQGFILQDMTGGMRVLSRQTNDVRVGDLVEAIGFPAIGDYSPYLEEADFRTLGAAPLPAAKVTTAEEILLHGAADAQIVQIDAQLLQSVPRSANPQLALQDGPAIFTAHLEMQSRRQEMPDLESGSRLQLTGVCSIQGGQGHEPETFRLLLRAPGDVRLLEAPPYWTARRSFMLAGGMMLAVSAALGWVALLRRQVRNQTQLIRRKLEDEAALEERYRELFENATDMLYTHDRAGRLTSINQTGERLLQQNRRAVLGRNILDFVVEEQRASARQWLDQALQGAALPAMEWDFAAASGERVKLEISARLISQDGQETEVEGIARDITERKRLELEILEISNREQRRIGHDLHDGICQQLAGIAFLIASLAEDLEQERAPQAAEAEKISGMINEAIDQTRGVARGLFPVRLAEKGLAAALEELAANTSEVYKIQCEFAAAGPPVEVENEIALHVYYIALEAVANTVKHSKAQNVLIGLQPSGDRWLLTVQDDGAGFAVPAHNHDGMGLRILHYRARVIGATLSLQSQPGSGTTVSCLFLPASRDFSRGAPRRRRDKPELAKTAQS
ncbi:MAG TPA: PAS domain S-box protein [Verrucomicrobiae bacterium]|jgi:PAS domain S-box-containing protein|nr:PAS domain S-box protein [Verrucomicrobiae bacterium]